MRTISLTGHLRLHEASQNSKKTLGLHSTTPTVVQRGRLEEATGPSVETRSSTRKSRKSHNTIIIVILYYKTSAAHCRQTKNHIGRKTLK